MHDVMHLAHMVFMAALTVKPAANPRDLSRRCIAVARELVKLGPRELLASNAELDAVCAAAGCWVQNQGARSTAAEVAKLAMATGLAWREATEEELQRQALEEAITNPNPDDGSVGH